MYKNKKKSFEALKSVQKEGTGHQMKFSIAYSQCFFFFNSLTHLKCTKSMVLLYSQISATITTVDLRAFSSPQRVLGTFGSHPHPPTSLSPKQPLLGQRPNLPQQLVAGPSRRGWARCCPLPPSVSSSLLGAVTACPSWERSL